MSGRVRVDLADGRTVTGYRKTLRQNPRRDLPRTPTYVAPECRLAFVLPADIAALVSPGPHGPGVEVGPLNNLVVTATTFDRARAFKLAANFLRAVTPKGHEPYTLAVDMTSSSEPGWRQRWRIAFCDGCTFAAITTAEPLVFPSDGR